MSQVRCKSPGCANYDEEDGFCYGHGLAWTQAKLDLFIEVLRLLTRDCDYVPCKAVRAAMAHIEPKS